MAENTLPITIEFGGGAELLFDKKKINNVVLPLDSKAEWSMKDLLYWIRDNLLKERLELFMQDDSVRPGILVLINDADWELMVPMFVQYKVNRVPEGHKYHCVPCMTAFADETVTMK